MDKTSPNQISPSQNLKVIRGVLEILWTSPQKKIKKKRKMLTTLVEGA
jgi:hypothetical protein